MKANKIQGPIPARRNRTDLFWFCLLGIGLSTSPVPAAEPTCQHGHSHPAAPDLKVSAASSPAPARLAQPALPPLPEGVTELKFSEFFVHPVGNRGLEFSEKLRKLDGQRVRLLGHMVRQDPAPPGSFLLTPIPIEIHNHEDHCFIDDLPPSTVQVSAPDRRHERIPYTPRLLLLTGTLSVGNQTEADGRISLVRLALDPPKPVAKKHFSQPEKGAERLVGGPRSTRSALASPAI
jgi:hypothetical protein